MTSVKPRNSLEVEQILQQRSQVKYLDDIISEGVSVASHDLFRQGKDNIVFEGLLYKFKPGLSSNFVQRYVQISERAFRYFKD